MQPTIPLDIIKATWLLIYLNKILLWEELVGLRAYMLKKHISYIEEMQECLTKEKIQRVLCVRVKNSELYLLLFNFLILFNFIFYIIFWT